MIFAGYNFFTYIKLFYFNYKKLLAGEKKLLKTKDVFWVENVPNWPEFSSKRLWMKAKINLNLSVYFADFTSSRLP
jgi:hypothetical protein